MNRYLIQLALISSMKLLACSVVNAQQVDFSKVSVPEETGAEFLQISKSSDYVAVPDVKRTGQTVSWLTNKILSISPDGNTLAYLSVRNDVSDIFLKDINNQGSSVQRTNRGCVFDFSFSPDGKEIVFSEKRDKDCQIFSTDASKGYVCRQITNSNQDYSPIYSKDSLEYIGE